MVNFDEFIAKESDFHKMINGIYITDNQIKILENYGIDINNFNNLNELICSIESYLNSSVDSIDDLEWVSESLSEYNYYANVNK